MSCPVCGELSSRPLLAVPDFPVYLHAMAGEAALPQQYRDLVYVSCPSCGHAYMPAFDREVLEDIYRQHYWGADVPSAGYLQREEFVAILQQLPPLQQATCRILEVGCSSGQMLAELAAACPQATLTGFEPNTANAATARARGFAVVNGFFTAEQAEEFLRTQEPVDILFHRHVIEHVFDFADFFAASQAVVRRGARLLIETPSLEAALATCSLDPFHHEHLHVFALSSLARLAARFGWQLCRSWQTSMGNLIAEFAPSGGEADAVPPVPLPPVPDSASFATGMARWLERLQSQTAGRRVVFWGAGSYCTVLLALCAVRPAAIVDGNPNRAGQFMAGMDIAIGHAPQVLAEWVARGDDRDSVLVIASSYHVEIRQALADIGWRGAVVVPALLLSAD